MKFFAGGIGVSLVKSLFCLPVNLIFGKFLAAMLFLALLLSMTMGLPLTLSFYGQLDWGPVVGGYIGAVLLGAAFSAIGLFSSALTRNQIIAFITAMAPTRWP